MAIIEKGNKVRSAFINFDNIEYVRIEYKKAKQTLEKLTNSLCKCSDIEEYIGLIKKIIKYQNHIEQMYDYADIRNMRNSEDGYYKNEIDFWNSNKVKFDSLFLPFYTELNNSRYKEQLINVLPSNFFRIIEYQEKITSDSVEDLIKAENDLKMQYRNLNNTKIMYDGEKKAIRAISGLFSNKDKNIRKKAHDAVNDFYYSKQSEYDNILFDLINTRNKIAKLLGFDNYVEYSLYKLKRFDYDYKDISKFRKNIIKHISPICKLMSEWQKEELGLNELKYYDTVFFTKMPEPKYTGKDLLKQLRKSFKSVDNELSNLFNNMLDNNYIDLLQRDNKVNFSITNYLTETCMPVITGNYKNNYLDIQTTTHEMGHSFQKYCASIEDEKNIVSPILKYPTMEVAEMFSYSMELIMMKHVENLFNKKDYNKYCFMKIYNLIANLPYICLVDEFQEKIYSKTNLKITDIREMWKTLVKKYGLEKNNSGHINLESGGYFYRQSHIYLDPFYYIDYALSYFGAFSIWNKCENDLDYFKEIGRVASYYSFKELITKYNMPDPFDEKTVGRISKKLRIELENRKIFD